MNVRGTKGQRRPPFLLVILGVSGSGKSTLLRYLESTYSVESAPKYTTRPERPGDEARDFLFVSPEEMPRDGLIIFHSYNHEFGVQTRSVEDSLKQGRTHAVVVGDRETASELVRRYRSAIVILAYCDPHTLHRRIVGDHASVRSDRWSKVEVEITHFYEQLGCVDVVIDCSGSVETAHTQIDELAHWLGL